METDRIKEILDGEIGSPLKAYLIEELNKLKDIGNVNEYPNAQDQSVEFKAQLKAYDKLNEILSRIMTITIDEEEPQENEYAVM
jgi:hypothetical protein